MVDAKNLTVKQVLQKIEDGYTRFENVRGTIKIGATPTAMNTIRGSYNLLNGILTDKTQRDIPIALWNGTNDDRKLVVGETIEIHNGIMRPWQGRDQITNQYGTTWKKITMSDKTTDMQKFAICWASDRGQEKGAEFNAFKEGNELDYLLWGVNWSIERTKLFEIKWPITGYIYHSRKIIAIVKIRGYTESSGTNFAPVRDKKYTVDLREWATATGYDSDYKNYLHIEELKLCKPFSHKKLKLFYDDGPIQDVLRQRVYVNKLNVDMPLVDIGDRESFEEEEDDTYWKILDYLGVEDK